MTLHANNSRRGAMLPLVALLLPVMLILASFVVNVAYMELTRTELRITSDSATRAAAHELLSTGDKAAARAAAREAATRNKVARQATRLANADIVFGVSRRASVGQRYDFTPGGTNVNAVSVNARRDSGSLSGMVSLVMPTFGAAREFGPSQSAIASQVELDVALVLDRSGSMAYGDLEDSGAMASAGEPPAGAPAGWAFCDAAPPLSRWRALADSVQIFLNVLNRTPQLEHVSLITYSDDAARDLDLSGSYANLTTALDGYTQSYCSGLTNIHAGIVEGVNSLNDARYARPWAVKVIVLLTDGRRTAGSNPEAAARQAFDEGVTVYTVTYSAEADVDSMKEVAKKGGGRHFHAASADDLREVFREIAGQLPTLLTK